MASSGGFTRSVLYDEDGNPVAIVLDGSVYRIQTQGKVLNASGTQVNPATQETLATIDADTGSILANQTNRTQLTKLTDGTNDMAVRLDGDTLASLAGLPLMGKTNADLARFLLTEDDGTLRVASQPPSAPPGTTEFNFAVDEAELDVGSGGDVSSPHTSLSSIIANSDNLFLQSIEAGTEGDSSENGSVVEVYWRTSGPTDHLIGRYYVAGESIQILLPDVNKARDNTQFTGDGANTRLVVIRRRLSVSALEIDFIVRGYTT